MIPWPREIHYAAAVSIDECSEYFLESEQADLPRGLDQIDHAAIVVRYADADAISSKPVLGRMFRNFLAEPART